MKKTTAYKFYLMGDKRLLKLENALTPREKLIQVFCTLKYLRTMLGTYVFDARTTQNFRNVVEPGLSGIWTKTCLEHYIVQIKGVLIEVLKLLKRRSGNEKDANENV